MNTFVFRCPVVGLNVQAWIEDEEQADAGAGYRRVTCLACQQVHLVNPSTERVLPSDDGSI